jgi:PAS domain S-box-containing protein
MRTIIKKVIFRTTFLYVFFGALWILLSDRALAYIISDARTLARLSTYKGWAFIVVTGLLLHETLRTQFRRWEEEAAGRRQAERDLGEREEKYRTLFETMKQGAFYRRADGAFVDVNPAALGIHGTSREEFLSRGPKEVFWTMVREDGSLIRREDFPSAVALKSGRPVENFVAGLLNHRTGSYVWVVINAIPEFRRDEDKPYQVFVTLHDITELKRYEGDLRKQQEFQAALLESMADAVVACDTQGKLTYVNRLAREWHGVDITELRWDELKHQYALYEGDGTTPLDSDKIPLGRARRGEVVREAELVLATKGQPKRHVRASGAPFYDAAGRLLGAVVVMHDTTIHDVEGKRQALIAEILEVLNTPGEISDSMHRILLLLKNHTAIEAIGIRLKEGEDYPYRETKGFSEEFVELERSLCRRDEGGEIVRDGVGSPHLECMCGSVISGRIDPALPFFTRGGSFWTNNASRLLAATSPEDLQTRTRNRCNGDGYRSVALIPLRSGGEMAGLLQLNDPRPDCFSLDMIEFLERVAASIAIAVSRQEAAARLAESERKYRSIFESAAVGIYQGSPEGKPVKVNPALAQMHGYDSAEEMEREVRDYGKNLFVDQAERLPIRERLAREGFLKENEAEMYRKDGSTFWGRMNSHVVKDITGRILYIEGMVQDITERKRLEDQLRQAQKMEAIGTLAGGVAHDFNNILTVIIGLGYMLQGELEQASPHRAWVDQIMASSQRAASLTQSLLAFSRKQKINLEPHNINDVIWNVGKLLKRLLTEDIELTLNLSDEDLTALTDVTQLDQVLMNLTSNARDAMPGGGTLAMETRAITVQPQSVLHEGVALKPGEYVLLSVSDNGIGMDEETQKRIFDPFFTTKEVGKGTGLGLSTVYGIVKQHEGYVTVSSEPGKGTTFRVYLPHVRAERRTDRQAQQTEIRKGTETILVVEDDEAVRKLIEHALKAYGYVTMDAVDGEDAVRVFGEYGDSIDLIILDVVMPRKNGKEALEDIKRVRPDARAIFISGYTGDVVIDKGVESESVDYVSKPLSIPELLVRVREVLDRRPGPQSTDRRR